MRDRGLDHAVEREKNLRPLLNLKNLIISEPSKSLPLSLITQSKDSLKIPFRPIEFIRRYTSIFEEFLPGGVGIQPHIKLTPEVLNFDKEEQLIYQSVIYKQDVADRLLKLLMVSRINQIPVRILDGLIWELGLPRDYVKTIVPEFPDYFRLKNESNEDVLELVCWSNELAVSAIEKKRMSPIEFPLKYSSGFEMDKKYKKWLDEWQKLPYISPYENAAHLATKSDESDKWAVAVLHEILNLFIGKKAERDIVLGLGEWLGLRSRFKRAMLQHPGIFYVSSKIRVHTVVLKEGYNRGMLVEKVPLMEMRFKYVQLMNTVKEDPGSQNVQKKPLKGQKEEELLEHDGKDEEEHGESHYLSDEESDDDYEVYVDDDDDNKLMISQNRGASPKKKSRDRESQCTASGRSAKRNAGGSKLRFHLRTETRDSRSVGRRSRRSLDDDVNEHSGRTNTNNRGGLAEKRFKGTKYNIKSAKRRN